MRILAIRGHNIASLAEPFDIDLTAAPLRDAGLFAITGETGAGKSSILDALCLALYGDCPRLGTGGANEDVPDAGGDPIKSRDARGVLRRGAAQGGAQVDFTAIDGQDYRAIWGARRARGRSDGRLQSVERAVIRLSDGQPLETQMTLVNDLVHRLTGLTYDEFRRTVLLAQGDFDAFLRADTNDRAALLEKVTGTQVYRDISTRIYDRTEDARSALVMLTTQRDAQRLLPDEARDALSAEMENLQAALQGGLAARDALIGDLQRHEAHDAAARRHTAAQTDLTEAKAAQAQATPDRERLALIDRAAPLRAPHDRMQGTTAALEKAQTADQGARAYLDECRTMAEETRKTLATQTAAAKALEADFKAFGPVWDKAATLDAQISGAGKEVTDAKLIFAARREEDAQAKQVRDDIQTRHGHAKADQITARTALDAHPEIATVARNWDQIARAFNAHDVASDAGAAATAAAVAAQQAIAEHHASLADLANEDRRDRTARAELADAAKVCAESLSALEATAPDDQANRLAARHEALTLLQRAVDDHAQACADALAAAQLGAAARKDQAEAHTAAQSAETARQNSEAAVLALTDPAEQAAAAVSDQARALRLRLIPGTPCPVCGATDHPATADKALAALAKSLRADLDAARQRAAIAQQSLIDANALSAGASARAQQADTAQARAVAQREDAARRYSAARPDSETTLPATPDNACGPISAALQDTATARAALRDTLARLATLRADRNRLASALESVSARIEARTDQRATITAKASQAEQDHALHLRARSDADTRRDEATALVAPALAAVGLNTETLAQDAQSARETLSARARWWTETESALLNAEARLAKLAPSLADANARQQAAETAAAAAHNTLQTRTQALETLARDRAALLNGETTESHRSAFNLKRQEAHAAREAAQAVSAEAETRLATAAERATAATTHLTEATEAAHSAALAFTKALTEAEIAPQALALALATTPQTTATLRAQLRAIDDRVTAATAALAARLTDLRAAEAAALPDMPLNDLRTALAVLDAEQAARRERIGAIGATLASDAETRQALTGLQARIDAAAATVEVWQAVNAAVGSRSGDKFARLAQSITLDVLADRANHHLSGLKPRYRLSRAGTDLALHVIDRDMGDQVRSTRSLSGGERFLVSLALALALSGMGERGGTIGGLMGTLFIDEGFGALDAESLDLAIDALEALQAQGRSVGVISHVEAMKDRIPVQIRVQRQGGGRSSVSVHGPV